MNKKSVLSYVRRSAVMLPAVPVLCLGIALCLIAGLGNDPFTSFQQGVAIQLGWSVGNGSLLCNISILVLFLFLDRKLIGSGSVVMSFGIGPFIDIWYNLLAPLFPAEMEMWATIPLMLLGNLIIVIALTWYIPLNVGLQALDMSALYIGRLIKKTMGTGLLVFNIIVFTCAFFMGADWGLGTLFNVLFMGKLMDIFLPLSGRVSCKLAGMPFNDVNAKD